jgi:hypothetical protein
MGNTDSEIRPEDIIAETEEQILADMDEMYDYEPAETPSDNILERAGVRIIDDDMDLSEIKRSQVKLISDIGTLNVELAKATKELSGVELVYERHKRTETLRVASQESAKPGPTSQKAGRALSNGEKEFMVEENIRISVEKTSPGYDILDDKLRLESLVKRLEIALKNVDRQGMLLSSAAKIGTEQERFGNHG